MKRPLKVFLYHAPSDKTAVRDLYLRLITDGVDAWFVKDKLLPGQDWKHEIRKAVRAADVVVVCLSERFDQGESGQKEVRLAFDTAIGQLEDELFLIPARLEECDRPTNLGKWQSVDLFAEAGYEMLMRALQARADGIGATVQRREGLPPQATTSSVEHDQPMPEEKPGETMQGILIEGSGILIEGPAAKLQRPTSQRKPGKAIIVALIGLLGIIVVAVHGSPQLERWYQLVFTAGLEMTQTSAPPIEVAHQVLKIPPANIILLIDTSESMQGSRIGIVKSAVSDFISKLNDNYLVSVIQFGTNVELRIDLTLDHTAARKVINSIDVDVTQKGSCLYDALYAGVLETSSAPVTEDTRNMIVVLTDISPGDIGSNCSAQSMDGVRDLQAKHPVSIFFVKVGDWNSLDVIKQVIGDTGGMFFSPDDKYELDHALLLVSDEAALSLNTESITPSSVSAETAGARRVPMVFVPSGEFIMGNNAVTLDAFWIGKTEVTNIMYARCVQAGKCNSPHSYRSSTRNSYYESSIFADYPVIFVSWTDANDYCTWAGGHLPTEAQWEKAARGTDGRQFPWGEEDPSVIGGLLNYRAQDTTEVGTYPKGASPYGALDMAGNVGEWVADWFSIDYYSNLPASNPLGPPSGEYRVWRGGSWANTSTEWIRTYNRTGNLPTDDSPGLGFRCARDATP